jgi:hypothetical protein
MKYSRTKEGKKGVKVMIMGVVIAIKAYTSHISFRASSALNNNNKQNI